MKFKNFMKQHITAIFFIGFFVLNIFNTYFLTVTALNKYIITFEYTFLSIVSSFLGNFSFLLILFLIFLVIFKKPKPVAISLTVSTMILNVVIFGLQYFAKNYKVAFSFFNFSMIKNPSGGFASNLVIDCIYELFIYYRIVCFIPAFLFIALLIIYRKDFPNEKINLNFKKLAIAFITPIFTIICTYQFYQLSLEYIWKFGTDFAQYGCQYAGAYPYYFSELIGIDNRKIEEDSNPTEEYKDLSLYNKNKPSYTNIIDGKTYHNIDNQTGLFKDKNIFVIQLESAMTFTYNTKFNDIEITPYMNKLINEDENCFFFNNAYTTVGVGNTSDAEFSFFTGYYPTGDMTIAWEFAEYDFDIKTLGDYISDYETHSYNPTNENFYYHNNLHEELYKIDNFRGLETYEIDFPRDTYPENYLNYWISDYSILRWARDTQLSANKNNKKSLAFVETITPHSPFNDLSKDLPNYTVYDFNLSLQYYQLTNYLNQTIYNDKLIYDFLMQVTDPNSQYYLEDTLFIIYGDHGNTLNKSAFEELYQKELTDFEYRKLLLNVPFIFYDPSGTLKQSINNDDLSTILNQTKSNTDLFRTVVNLLGIDCDTNYYGTNIFSGEPSFTYDPKNLDIITDDFIYNIKNGEYEVYNDKSIDLDLINNISNYRMAQDEYIISLVYSAPKRIENHGS